MKTRVRTYPAERKAKRQVKTWAESVIFTVSYFFLFLLFAPILATLIWVVLLSRYKFIFIWVLIIMPFVIVYYKKYALLYTFRKWRSYSEINLENLNHHNKFFNNLDAQRQWLKYLNWELRHNYILKIVQYLCVYFVGLFMGVVFLWWIFISNELLFWSTLLFLISIITYSLVCKTLDEIRNYHKTKITQEDCQLLFKKIHTKIFFYQKESKKIQNKDTFTFY